MKAENQTTTMSVKLTPETKAKLLHLSKMKDRSPHWLMNKAITEYVEIEDHIEKDRQETLRIWDEIERGETVEHEKVLNWLRTWGNEKEEDIKP